jgi:alpha-tubulin suppressor-like RCC1 family protein
VLLKEIEALRGVDVASVSVATDHALALTYTGGVYSWGDDAGDAWMALGHGRSFDGDPAGSNLPILRLPRRIEALRGVRVRCVAAGEMHSCAVTDEGHVYTWGQGETGALGHMEFQNEPLPKRVETLHDKGVLAVGVAAGGFHTLVADADGAVWGFGGLNSIGAWDDPTVKAMRDAEDGITDDDSGLFRRLDYEDEGSDERGLNRASFNFLHPHGCADICMPVRVPVDVRGARAAGATRSCSLLLASPSLSA